MQAPSARPATPASRTRAGPTRSSAAWASGACAPACPTTLATPPPAASTSASGTRTAPPKRPGMCVVLSSVALSNCGRASRSRNYSCTKNSWSPTQLSILTDNFFHDPPQHRHQRKQSMAQSPNSATRSTGDKGWSDKG